MQLSKSPIKLFKSWRLGHYVKMDAHLWTVQQTFQILTDNPVISIHLESRKPLTCVSKHQSLCILWWHVTLISQCLSLLALTEAILFASCVMSTTKTSENLIFGTIEFWYYMSHKGGLGHTDIAMSMQQFALPCLNSINRSTRKLQNWVWI